MESRWCSRRAWVLLGYDFQRVSCRFPTNVVCHPSIFRTSFTTPNRIKPIHLNEALSASPASIPPLPVSIPPLHPNRSSRMMLCLCICFLVNPSVKLPLSCGGQGTDSRVGLLDHKAVTALRCCDRYGMEWVGRGPCYG